MPVGQLDEATLNSQGLGKPTPKGKRQTQVVSREDVGAVKEVVPPEPVGDDDIRMPDPNPGTSVDSEDEVSVPETQTTADYFKSIFSPELREVTKKILMNSDEGKELLEEIGITLSNNVSDNQLSPWEQECLQQIRSSLNQFQDQEELQVQVQVQVLLPLQPFVFSIKK